MAKRFRLVLFIAKAVSAGIIICSVLLCFFMVAPAIETKFFPVVGKLKIIDHISHRDGTTTITAAFTKKRACEYVGISWTHILPDGTHERVAVILGRDEGDTSSPTRPVGTTVAGPWKLPIPWDEVENHSLVQLYHRCNPMWLSTTDFYP